MTKVNVGDKVRLWSVDAIPVRYQGRSGIVVARHKRGRGFQYSIDLYPRKVTPLMVSRRSFDVL